MKVVLTAYNERDLCGDEYLQGDDVYVSFQPAGTKIVMRINDTQLSIDDARYLFDAAEFYAMMHSFAILTNGREERHVKEAQGAAQC